MQVDLTTSSSTLPSTLMQKKSQSIVFLIYLQRHKFLYPLDHKIIHHLMSHLFFRTAKGTENPNIPIATNAFLSHPKLNRLCMATISKDPNISSPFLHEPVNDRSITSLPKRKKEEVLSDLCDGSTLFFLFM